MKRAIVWVVVLVMLGGGTFAAYRWYRSRDGATTTGAFRTVPATHTDIVATISATGTIVPEDVVDVGAQVNGQIASFGLDHEGKPVDYRSAIDEGAVLARIDESLYAADVATAEAQLAQAQAQVRVAEAGRGQARARLEQAQRDWDRAQKLGQSRALSQADFDASKSNFDQAQASLALSEATIGQGRAQVAIAEAAVLRSRRNLTYCTIKSPVSGVIIDRRVDIGQTVVASLNAPSLFLIARDLSRMQVLVQVNEADIGHVQPKTPVTFSTDAFPGESFKGEVRKVRLNATLTQNVVTYTVEIVTENKDLKLLPYLTANVRFTVERRENVLAVPNAALRWSPPEGAPIDPTAEPAAASSASPAPAAPVPARPANGVPGASPSIAGAGGRAGGGAGKAPGTAATVWVLGDNGLRPVSVRPGLSDGAMTEIRGDTLHENDAVVISEALPARNGASAAAGSNPFAPPVMRGRR